MLLSLLLGSRATEDEIKIDECAKVIKEANLAGNPRALYVKGYKSYIASLSFSMPVDSSILLDFFFQKDGKDYSAKITWRKKSEKEEHLIAFYGENGWEWKGGNQYILDAAKNLFGNFEMVAVYSTDAIEQKRIKSNK